MASRHGAETFDLTDTVVDELRDRTDGRGADSVVDAVGLEAHGNPGVKFTQNALGCYLTRSPRSSWIRPAWIDSLRRMPR